MKVVHDKGNTYWQAESPEEAAAIAYVRAHVPLFAGTEFYGIEAFQAGIEWEKQQARKIPAETRVQGKIE